MKSVRGASFGVVSPAARVVAAMALAWGLWFALVAMANSKLPVRAEPRTVVSLQPTVREAQVGDALEFRVRVEGAYDLGGFNFVLGFDPKCLQFDDVELDEFLGSTGRLVQVVSKVINPSLGVAVFDATSEGETLGPSGVGTLAILTGRATRLGETYVRLLSLTLVHSNGSVMVPPPVTEDAYVTVGSPTPTPTGTGAPHGDRRRAYLPVMRKPLVLNPGFEGGAFWGWQVDGVLRASVVYLLHTGQLPSEGQYCALLGNPDYRCEDGVPVGEARISQWVNVPNAPNPRLGFSFRLFSQDASSEADWQDFDRFEVRVRSGEGEETKYFHANLTEGSGCERVPYDSGWWPVNISLDAYRGERVEVILANVNYPDHWYNTWTYVDDVSISWDSE